MKKRSRGIRGVGIFILALLFGLILSSTLYVRAFQVPALPQGNLVTNPWFRSFSNETDSALDGWTDAGGLNRYWSSSQKEANPAPDIFSSGVCGGKPAYCGTAARLSTSPGQSGGVGVRGVDSYLYQVVKADSSKTKLKFFTHWVSHLIDPAEVVIYGGDSATGPWTKVWVPFHVVVDQLIIPPPGCGSTCLWEETGWLDTVLTRGYNYYKIEIHARLSVQGTTGFKISGIYFAVVDPNSNDPTPTSPTLPTKTPSSQTPNPPPGTPTPSPSTTLTPLPSRENLIYIPAAISD